MFRPALLFFVIVIFCFSAEAQKVRGIAENYAGDKGIGNDDRVIYASGFEDGIRSPLKVSRKGVSVLKDKRVAHSGKACAKIVATKNIDEGGDLKLHWKDGVERCYMRVYIRFDKDTLMPHHFINLKGQTPTYKYRWGGAAGLKPSGGKDGAISVTLEPAKDDKDRWFFYSYWHEMRSWQTEHGASQGKPNAYYGNVFKMKQGPKIKRDQWICVEMMVKLNTAGEYDGEQAFWIDGKLIGHWKKGLPKGTWMRGSFHSFGKWNRKPRKFEGFNWRASDAIKINKAMLQWYLSRDQSWPRMRVKENIVYFDDLVVATGYVGPMKMRGKAKKKRGVR